MAIANLDRVVAGQQLGSPLQMAIADFDIQVARRAAQRNRAVANLGIEFAVERRRDLAVAELDVEVALGGQPGGDMSLTRNCRKVDRLKDRSTVQLR